MSNTGALDAGQPRAAVTPALLTSARRATATATSTTCVELFTRSARPGFAARRRRAARDRRRAATTAARTPPAAPASSRRSSRPATAPGCCARSPPRPLVIHGTEDKLVRRVRRPRHREGDPRRAAGADRRAWATTSRAAPGRRCSTRSRRTPRAPASRRRHEARAGLHLAVTAAISYPPELPVSAARGTIARGDPRPPGRRRRGRDRLGQDDAAPEDLPRARARGRRHDRAHAAAPARGAHGRRRGSPRSSTSSSARTSATRCGSPTARGRTRCIRLMTDGILLAEIQRDRLLRRYDTIIVDEAHERSLNIDFLLGYLKRLLPKRPDLKLIITSATIDPQRFAEHFGGAPVDRGLGPHVPGRGPLPPAREDERPRPGGRDRRRGRGAAARAAPGDVLVFLPGEREIRDTADALRRPPALRHRGAAALRAAVGGRAAPRVRSAHCAAPRRARDQRRRDVADRARHPLRRRPRHRAHQPLQRAAEGAAAADRADLAGVGRPAHGPLRPHRRRHLHPALRRGGLRGAPALHRPRDPAHEPRRR